LINFHHFPSRAASSEQQQQRHNHRNPSHHQQSSMDPCRIRAYLQVACAGLGFEIGEIWWTGNEHGSSTVAAIGEY